MNDKQTEAANACTDDCDMGTTEVDTVLFFKAVIAIWVTLILVGTIVYGAYRIISQYIL